MRISVFDKFGAKNSAPVFAAITEALQRQGHQVVSHDTAADAAVIWSVLWHGRMAANRDIWLMFKASQRPVFVCEVGSIRRNHTWRVGLNGCFQWEHFVVGDTPRYLAGLDTWRIGGNHIVITCQHQRSEQWNAMPNMLTWIENTVSEIKYYTDLPIVVRMHPRDPINLRNVNLSRPIPIADTYDDFDYDQLLKKARCVVNWNSGAGITSLIKGVPVISSRESLCRPISGTDLAQVNNPPEPDRDQWFGRLGWTEWTLDEIRQGLATERLLPKAF
jgi:hypothetical protein